MTSTATPALDGLAEREKTIEDARERVTELETEARTTKRDLDRALVPLQDYYRSLEAGEREPDTDVEAELREAVDTAQSSVAPQTVYNPRAGMGQGLQVELVNPELEGKLAGARQKVTDAQREYDLYLRATFDDLAVELATLGTQLADRYAPVVAHARKAQDEWVKLRHRWRPLVELADFDWSDFPQSPFSGATEVRALMPRQLAEGAAVRGPSAPRKRKRAS